MFKSVKEKFVRKILKGNFMRQLIKSELKKVGYRLVREQNLQMVYQHEYSGGYDQYKDVQISANKMKLEKIWADRTVLDAVVGDLRSNGIGANGICHGARNGFEVDYLRGKLSGDVIGTDISDTATQFPNMVVWDFHEQNPEWQDKFDFVYSNSLDQAMDPARALQSWAGQVKPNGRIYIEHTMLHSPSHAGEMDPFGAHPMAMPFLFFKWGRGRYQLEEIIEVGPKSNNHHHAWIFVLTRVEA